MSIRPSTAMTFENARKSSAVVDLHAHSTISDGLSDPAELMRAMAAAGVTLAALTDHDAMGGVDEARAAAQACGMGFLPGAEISAGKEERLHILGLNLDADSIADVLEDARMKRRARIGEMIARLEALHIPMETSRARNLEGTERAASRMTLARELIARGHARDAKEAFARYIGPGAPAYVSVTYMKPETIIERIHRAGGVAILAHPGRLNLDFSGREPFVRALADMGLDGLEAWHPAHDADAVAYWRGVAARAGLMTTIGSDFHGHADAYALKPGLPLGEAERMMAGFRDLRGGAGMDRAISAWPMG